MEAAAEAVYAAKEQQQSLILKGKRTKRQRPLSPIPFSIIPPQEDSTSLVSKKSTSSSSTSSSSNATLKATSDEEDQDMANCLILLAQGHFLPQPQQTRQLMISYHQESSGNRSSSRRFLETSSSNGITGGGKAGYYVYQCKTCDRTFPSFQALGGHRASHKKPKALLHSNHDLKKSSIYDDTVSLHLNNVITTSTNNHRSLVVYGNKGGNNKVHECGICGAEFTSGQALGGHMRRHRGSVVAAASVSTATVAGTASNAAILAVPATTANTALSLSPMSFDQMSEGMVQGPVKRARTAVVSLDLDLNLPAPEDENRVNGLRLGLKQEHEQEHEQRGEEQKSLVSSSTPTLVDCHY